ncbi:MAG: pyridoxal kinase, partial [Nocardioidaceae bacterium]|nr:pyridoxal kinase [Nocardioidaceae bacterium]
AADAVRRTGPATVLVTSVIVDDTPDDALDLVAVSDAGAWRIRTPRLAHNPQGAGDLTAAVFLANLLDGHDLATTLARTTSSVFAVVEATHESGAREMRIVQAQDRLADPRMEFAAEPVR